MKRTAGFLGLFFVAALASSNMGGCPAAGDNPGGLVDGFSTGPGGNTGNGGNAGNGDANGAGDGGIIDPNNKGPTAVVTVSPTSGIRPAATVTLDASGSSDPDGDELAFDWQQTSGLAVSLSASSGASVTFSAPFAVETAELKFTMTVTDGRGGSSAAEATLIVEVSDEFAGYSQAVSRYRDSLTSDEAYHLLRRAAFGATPADVARAVQRGLNATVDDLLTVKAVPETLAALSDSYEDEVEKRWMVHLIEGPNPLLERMTMFWHDRFATSRRVATDYRDRNLGVMHWQMLRSNALGNYRQFLESLTLDPLMLIWLNGEDSPKDSPNENYAREFWELFTLGRDQLYTESDIREGARAFTGVTLLRDYDRDTRPIFDLVDHDETIKTIFPGRASAANYNYETVIDLTLAQPEAAKYVARNVFKFFVHDEPSDAVVAELADEFTKSGFEIAPLVRQVLTCQALFSPEARGNQVASPVEHVVGVARTFEMHINSEDSQGYILDRLINDLSDSGQHLLDPPGVEGWHENVAWMQDQWVLSRIEALGRTMEYGPELTPDLPYHLLPPVSEWADREIRGRLVDAVAAVFHLKLPAEERDVYIEVLDQDGWRAFHLEDPDYQPRQVFEMIRLMTLDERVIGR